MWEWPLKANLRHAPGICMKKLYTKTTKLTWPCPVSEDNLYPVLPECTWEHRGGSLLSKNNAFCTDDVHHPSIHDLVLATTPFVRLSLNSVKSFVETLSANMFCENRHSESRFAGRAHMNVGDSQHKGYPSNAVQKLSMSYNSVQWAPYFYSWVEITRCPYWPIWMQFAV